MGGQNVIPTQEQIDTANATNDAKIAEESQNKQIQVVSSKEQEAILEMEQEARDQVAHKKSGGQIIREELIDTSDQKIIAVGASVGQQVRPAETVKPKVERPVIETRPIQSKVDIPMERKVSPQPINVPYDLIPLPSGGKIYPHKKSALKVAYLNATDENILTSPNILESGDFLEILLNRKILDEGIQLKDLHVGDRNAIMIWLRATGYGEMYPIILYDNDDKPVEIEVDLSTLPYKPLGAEPDKEGLIHFHLDKSNKDIKLKLLTVGDIADLEELTVYELTELNLEYANTVTHRLEKMIVEIDGIRDRDAIDNFIAIMPAMDSRAVRNFYNDIESNVDLNIKVEVPGGDLIETFLPINLNFFWPDFGV